MTGQPELYSGISGGRVLDVGTGRGGFVGELVAELKDYDEIVGIDVDDSLAEEFGSGVGRNPRVRFETMDVLAMPFEDGSFDTVSMAGSLHHLSEPQEGLEQMLRVLRPGGRLIVVEMYRDGQTEAQQTHVMLHHWWGALDRLDGIDHRETYTREEILDFVNSLRLARLTLGDYAYLEGDPRDLSQHKWLEPSMRKSLDRAAGHADLVAEGESIRQRISDVGFHLATVLVAMGEKRLDH